VKQSKWKEQIELIEAEMHRLGQASDAPAVLREFSKRLSSTIHHFFSETVSFVPDSALTIEQQSFIHSLQLYNLQSFIDIIVDYETHNGTQVI
jgi:hypothetical protein